jgi:hypothetical protein
LKPERENRNQTARHCSEASMMQELPTRAQADRKRLLVVRSSCNKRRTSRRRTVAAEWAASLWVTQKNALRKTQAMASSEKSRRVEDPPHERLKAESKRTHVLLLLHRRRRPHRSLVVARRVAASTASCKQHVQNSFVQLMSVLHASMQRCTARANTSGTNQCGQPAEIDKGQSSG